MTRRSSCEVDLQGLRDTGPVKSDSLFFGQIQPDTLGRAEYELGVRRLSYYSS